MPSTLHFAAGAELKVTAELDELEGLLREGQPASLRRFAGFRGDEVVAAETVLVNMAQVAYAMAIANP